MRFGLVLGAGGVVGMSYHAGVLHALAAEGGLDPGAADLIVGTSAGSVIGTLLRSGWSAEDCWRFALEEHPVITDLDEAERARRKASTFTTRPESNSQRARRAVGSAYVATRSMVKAPLPRVPGFVARRFPAGVFDNHDLRGQLAEVVPHEWPDDPLWLVAVDVLTGRRVVLRKSGATGATLQQAVLSSCAIPGIFPPVKVGRRVLVDGGAHSSTHLDLAASWGCDVILGVVPMAFDPTSAPGAVSQLVRRNAARDVSREARFARARGAEVLLVRPCAEELRIHGRDMMRPSDTGAIARAAYECTARLLETPRFRRVLDGGGDIVAA
jgi:NTE family protein